MDRDLGRFAMVDEKLFLDVEDGVARPILGKTESGLRGAHHLARIDAAARNDTARIGAEDRVVEILACGAKLGFGHVHGAGRRGKRLFRILETAAGRVAAVEKVLLSVEGGPSLSRLRLGRGDSGLRRGNVRFLFDRIETGEHVAGLDLGPDIDGDIRHPAARLERIGRRMTCGDLARQADGPAEGLGFDRDIGHRRGRTLGCLRLVAAGKGRCRDENRRQAPGRGHARAQVPSLPDVRSAGHLGHHFA